MKSSVQFALLFLLLVSAKSFAQWTTGTNISNTNTGQVSIGTTGLNDNTSVKLTVYNDANPTTLVVGNPSTGAGGFTSIHMGTSANTNGYGFLEALRSSGSAFGNLIFNRFNGNVGIGTIAPGSYKLAVAGKIAAWGEIKVFTDGSSFPDYVFAPEYKLRSLEETEKYVKENHHLPEVPSAAEIAKDGMSLNGMNEILLKKVEELTLYIIEQNKRIQALEEKLKDK